MATRPRIIEATPSGMNDANGCSTCEVGKEKYEKFHSRTLNVDVYHYEYRALNGELFTRVISTLERAREERDKWLKEKPERGRKIMKVTFSHTVVNEIYIPEYRLKESILAETKKGWNATHIDDEPIQAFCICCNSPLMDDKEYVTDVEGEPICNECIESLKLEEKYKWESFKEPDGTEGVKTSFATIWFNPKSEYCDAHFTWHTWDKDGTGGENGIEGNLQQAKNESIQAAIRQEFISKITE